jgi:hypothetical protein
MAKIHSVLSALTQGRRVRRQNWLRDTHLFLQNDSIMFQAGIARPWRCALTWDEITAPDWHVLEGAYIAQHVHPISMGRPAAAHPSGLLLEPPFSELRARFKVPPGLILRR